MRETVVQINFGGSSPFAPDRRRKRKLQMHAAALGPIECGTQGSLRAHYSAGAMLMQNAKTRPRRL